MHNIVVYYIMLYYIILFNIMSIYINIYIYIYTYIHTYIYIYIYIGCAPACGPAGRPGRRMARPRCFAQGGPTVFTKSMDSARESLVVVLLALHTCLGKPLTPGSAGRLLLCCSCLFTFVDLCFCYSGALCCVPPCADRRPG